MEQSSNVDGTTDTLYIHNGLVVEPPSDDTIITREVNLDGRVVMPFSRCSYTSISGFVRLEFFVGGYIYDEQYPPKVSEHVNTEPDLPWVVGYGWIKDAIENPSGFFGRGIRRLSRRFV